MARRTLTTTWRNIERLIEQHRKRCDNDKLEELNRLLERVNKSSVVSALATLFINPYHGMEEAQLRFAPVPLPDIPQKGEKARFSPEENILYVNVLEVLNFRQECQESRDNLTSPAMRKSFHHYRYHAFLAELSKLPNQLLFFLLILEEVANVLNVASADKRKVGGEEENSEARDYLQLLWGFKELENFMRQHKGIDLRSEYSLLWQESNWFVGR